MYPINTIRIKPKFRPWRNFTWPSANERLWPTGLGWLIIALLLGLIGSFISSNNSVYYAAVVASIYLLFVALAYGVINLMKLDIRIFPKDGVIFAQAPATMLIEVFHYKTNPAFMGGNLVLKLQDSVKTLRIPHIPVHERTTLELLHTFTRRGRHELYVTSVWSEAPIGVARFRIAINQTQPLLVYPALIELDVSPSFQQASHKQTTQPSMRAGEQEFHGLRNYQLGDGLQKIHWKSSAKNDKLLIQQHHQQNGNTGLKLLLMTSRQMWSAESFEFACSLVFTLIWSPQTRTYIQGVFINQRYYPTQTQQQVLEFSGWLSTLELQDKEVVDTCASDVCRVRPLNTHAALYYQQSIIAQPST